MGVFLGRSRRALWREVISYAYSTLSLKMGHPILFIRPKGSIVCYFFKKRSS
jgi:hypothetical protein